MTNTTQLEEIAVQALKESNRVIKSLGAGASEHLKHPNQFGEVKERGDVEAEKAVIDTLRKAKVPIRIYSEEHGLVDAGTNPQYLGVLDGLDGPPSNKNRYGTMFGIFSNTNPKYGDYLFSGIMEHNPQRLFFVSRGKGSFVISADGKRQPIHCSKNTKLDRKSTRIYADVVFDEAMNSTFIRDTFLSKLRGFDVNYLLSSAAHYADLASGQVDLVLECTRKLNLEIAASFGLVNEAGGVMLANDGTNLYNKKYLQFGQTTYIPVITASTKELAGQLINHIKDKY